MAAILGGLLAFALLVPAVFLLQTAYEWSQRRIDAFDVGHEGPAEESGQPAEGAAAVPITGLDVLPAVVLRRELDSSGAHEFYVVNLVHRFRFCDFEAADLFALRGRQRSGVHATAVYEEKLSRLKDQVAELSERVAYLETEKHYWEPGVAQRELRPRALQEVHE